MIHPRLGNATIPAGCRWRVHRQACWPRIFDNLAGAIGYLLKEYPVWYNLDYEVSGEWVTLILSPESRDGRHAEGIEDKT